VNNVKHSQRLINKRQARNKVRNNVSTLIKVVLEQINYLNM